LQHHDHTARHLQEAVPQLGDEEELRVLVGQGGHDQRALLFVGEALIIVAVGRDEKQGHIVLVGVGEGIDDIELFDPETFSDAIL
jgi:hypothetical protein